MSVVLLFFSIQLGVQSLDGVSISPQGFLETVVAGQLPQDHDIHNAKTRARLGLKSQAGDAALTISADAIYNAILQTQNGFHLYETYAGYFAEKWDVRIGRQIIVWGKADGLRLVDLLCPTDLTEFITYEFDDMRIPVNALRFRLLFESVELELVGIPTFTPSKYPGEDSPWYSNLSFPANVIVTETKLPENNAESMEAAARLAVYLPGADLAVSALYVWDDDPVLQGIVQNNDLVVTPTHNRLSVFGLEVAVPLQDFVLRSEVAYYVGRHFQDNNLIEYHKRDMVSYLVGLDWFAGSGWTLSAQFAVDSIIKWKNSISDSEHNILGTMSVSKKLLRETLLISSMVYVDFIEPGLFERLYADYSLTDAFHVFLGFDVIAGNDGLFGQYKDNSTMWFKAKYNF